MAYAIPRQHHRNRYRYGLIAIATTLLLLLFNGLGIAQAQSAYPPFLDPHVNDYGQILESADASYMRTKLSQFQAQTGIQVVVVTVNSVRDYGRDTSIESFATNLFNTWGVGDRDRDDGILMVVAPGDRQTRIELGSGYGSQYDTVAQTIIDDAMLPQFRDGLFSRGTVAGVDAITTRFQPGAATGVSATRSGRGWADGGELGGIPGALWGVMGVCAAALGGGFQILRYWNRHRDRTCPQCNTQMVRLDEHADDQYLDAGRRQEESLKSVDYDVWRCPSCGYHSTHRYENLLSRYGRCPRCTHKTLSVHKQTVTSPTYSREGQERIKEDCRHCGYHDTRYRTIPRLERDNDSSGSHGGGGRSSGGGASGSW